MHKVLVVTTDYEVLQRVRGILDDETVHVQPGYSHLDAMYLLNSHPFDSAFIDASVIDRRTEEPTYVVIRRTHPEVPCVIYAPVPSGQTAALERSEALTVITSLDESALARAAETLVGSPRNGQSDADAGRMDSGDGPDSWSPEETRAVLTLSRSLTEVLDLNELLGRIVTAARDLSGAEEGMILLPDGDGDQLYLRAKVGIDLETARNFRVRTQDSVAGAVYKSGSPTLVGQSGPQKLKTEYFVKSLLYVPILLKGCPIGVLGVNNKQRDDVFNLRQQELLMHLASYAAIAIENARVHGQSVKRAKELKALVDSSERLNLSLQFEHTLQAAADQLIDVLNVNDGLIFGLDRERGTLNLLARRRHVLWRGGQEPLLDLATLPTIVRALHSGSPRLIGRASGGREAEWLSAIGAGSLLVIPVSGDGQLLGALIAMSRDMQPADAMPPADALARARQLTVEIVIELSRGRERAAQQIYRLADEINAVLGCDWNEVGLLADDLTMALQSSVGRGLWLQEPALSFAYADYPDVAQAIDQQAVINVHRSGVLITYGQRALLEFTGDSMIVALPIVHRGVTTGLIVCGDSEHDHLFSSRELDLAKAVAGQVTAALQNARLYSELQQNIQELSSTQSRLIQAERMSAMGELAAAVAHQINNPLTTILSDGQLLLERSPRGSAEAESLEAIVRAGKRAKGVVRRLLAAVRTTEPSGFELIDVAATVRETVALVRPHLIREGLRIYERVPDEDMPPVRAVPGELDDIWLNLLLNAHDALAGQDPAEVGVELRYLKEERVIEVSVWDNGPGIPPDALAYIFQPFFTTKPAGEGTGLGLHIARQVVDRVGGSILVDSEPGTGTRFTVLLPVLS